MFRNLKVENVPYSKMKILKINKIKVKMRSL